MNRLVALFAIAQIMLPQIRDIAVTTATTYEQGIPPKGSIATLFCRGLKGVDGIIAANALPLPRDLAGVRVTVGGAPAPLFAVAAFPDYQQINFQVPHEAVFVNDRAEVRVEQSQDSGAATFTLRPPPGDFFRLDQDFGIVQRASDSSLITRDNPARPGDHLVAYLTGLPGTNPIVPTGERSPTPPALVPQPSGPSHYEGYNVLVATYSQPPTRTTFYDSVEVLFLGLTPGAVGLYQVNFRLPEKIDPELRPGEAAPTTVQIQIERWACDRAPGNACPSRAPSVTSTPVGLPVSIR